MEEKIINKLREQKHMLRKISKYVKGYIDYDSEINDSQTLYILSLISKIDEEITDIIYIIKDSKN